MALDIAGYVGKVSVGCIPYRSCEAADVFGVVRELRAMSVSAQLAAGERGHQHSPRPGHASRPRTCYQITVKQKDRKWKARLKRLDQASHSLSIAQRHSTLAINTEYVKLARVGTWGPPGTLRLLTAIPEHPICTTIYYMQSCQSPLLNIGTSSPFTSRIPRRSTTTRESLRDSLRG